MSGQHQDPELFHFEALRRAWSDSLTRSNLSASRTSCCTSMVIAMLQHCIVLQDSVGPLLKEMQSATVQPDHRARQIAILSRYLKDMSVTWRLSNPDDIRIQNFPAAIVQALEQIARYHYSASVERPGNWWYWEIGIPIRLLDVLVLLGDHVPAALQARLLAAIARFAPDPSRLREGRSPATGANCGWSSAIAIRRAVLESDSLRLMLGLRTLAREILECATSDGFHPDGSFIQHRRYAYTGGYGVDFLLCAAEIACLLRDCPWPLPQEACERLVRNARCGLLPLLVDGAVMDMVRGREISRAWCSDHAKGHMALRALLLLAEVAPPADAALFRGTVKHHILSDRARDFFAFDPLVEPENIPIAILDQARQLCDDPSIPALSPTPGSVIFAEMDRVVHRAPGFTLGLAMYGERTVSYESMNAENLHGWFTALGMTSLYLPGDTAQFQDGFWPTVDPCRLPGTTTTSRHPQPGAEAGVAGGAIVGGVALGGAAVAAMSLKADSGRLTGRKSWFLFEDGVTALGSRIADSLGAVCTTTIENRNLGEGGACRLTGPGGLLELGTDALDVSAQTWLHLEGVGGYIMPKQPGQTRLLALLDRRSGAWRDINRNPASPAKPLQRNYLTLWIEHGGSAKPSGYAYTLLPGRDAAATAAFEAAAPHEVLVRNFWLDAVRHRGLGITAGVAWRVPQNGSGVALGPLQLLAPACALLRETAEGLEVAIAPLATQKVGWPLLRLACQPHSLDPRLALVEAGVLRLAAPVRAGQALQLILPHPA